MFMHEHLVGYAFTKEDHTTLSFSLSESAATVVRERIKIVVTFDYNLSAIKTFKWTMAMLVSAIVQGKASKSHASKTHQR